MPDVKQILVVDDHFEMLESLRAILETSNHDYQVLGVPSAEEGFLELRRTPFDLLITDVRLPGMSGFELVRRVQGVRPDLPILMITAYSSSQGKAEAESLGIYRYFQKPLNTDTLLAAVHSALHGEETPVEEERAVVPAVKRRPAAVSPESDVQARLRSLRSDTGAAQVVLADAQGTVLFTAGPENGSDYRRLAEIMSKTLENSLLLADELRSEEPLMIQYQSGERVDLYSANIGRDFFVMLFFETQARRGRIGTIWIFAQRAVRDLKDLLGKPGESGLPDTDELAHPHAEEISGAPEAAGEEKEVVSSFLSPVAEEQGATGDEEPLPEEFLAEIEGSELALLLENGKVDVAEVDLDAFWEAATSEENESASGGLSLEEAREQGLIPPEFDEPKQ